MVSVIVPVYNVSSYLERCLDSIVGQTYRDIEIILVDDGSTDDSGIICDKYSAQDNRITVIHKANGGVSSARNIGITHSKGDYVMFVDSDDVVELDIIEVMLSHAKETDSDIICCLLDVVEIDGKTRELTQGKVFGKISTSEVISRYFDDMFIKDQMYGPVNKLFPQSIIKRHRFSDYRMGEDILFIFELLLDCESVYIVDYNGYHYIHRTGSAMTSTFSPKRFDYLFAGKRLLELCHKHTPYAYESAQRWLYRHKLVTLRQLLVNGLGKQYSEIFNQTKTELKNGRHCLSSLSVARKLDYFGVMYCPLYFSILKLLKH